MGRRTFHTETQQSTALPIGGKTGALAHELAGSCRAKTVTDSKQWTRGGPKTVDDTTTRVDRHKTNLSRTDKPDTFKMFVPLQPEEIATSPIRGALCEKHVHTDPFAEGRTVPARRSRIKVKTPRGVERNRRLVKYAPPPEEPKKAGFITANGVRHTIKKQTRPELRTSTTIDRPQPPKDFSNNTRYLHSPDKQDAVRVKSPEESLRPSPQRRISHALVDDVKMLQGESQGALPPQPRRQGVKLNTDKHKQLTMEGVMGVPMRNGQPPKPSATAPWNQETVVPAPTRRPIAQPQGGAPYALEYK